MSTDDVSPTADSTTRISYKFSCDAELLHLLEAMTILSEPLTPSPPISTFSDIPLEMLMEIVPWIDTPSLLNFAKVNRISNRLALEEYWKREHISPKTLIFDNFNWPNKSKEILGTFSLALFLERVESIYCRFGSNVSHLWDQTYAMILFLQNLDSVGTFDIFFDWSSVEDDVLNSDYERVERGEYWYTVFVTVLDLLVEKGCTRLKILEPRCLQIPLIKHIEMGPNPAEQLKSFVGEQWGKSTRSSSWHHMVEDWWWRELERVKTAPTSPLYDWIVNQGLDIHHSTSISNLNQSSTSTLQELELSSRMMFFPLFYLKTLDILKVHGSTLHTLTFNRMVLNRSGWKELFNQVYFPVLESFTIVSNVIIPEWEYSFVTFDLLTNFLIRHETTIVTLELYTIFMLYSIPIGEEPKMSKLKRLVAQPLIISTLSRNPKHCSMLKSVCILAEYPSNLGALMQDDEIREEWAYDRFDEALESIGILSQDINLEVDCKVEDGLKDWLMKHISGLDSTTTTTLANMNISNVVNTSNTNETVISKPGQNSKSEIKPSPPRPRPRPSRPGFSPPHKYIPHHGPLFTSHDPIPRSGPSMTMSMKVMEGLNNVKRLDIVSIGHDTYSMVGIVGFVVSWVMLFPSLEKLVFGFEFGTRIIENYKELSKFEPVVEIRKRI